MLEIGLFIFCLLSIIVLYIMFLLSGLKKVSKFNLLILVLLFFVTFVTFFYLGGNYFYEYLSTLTSNKRDIILALSEEVYKMSIPLLFSLFLILQNIKFSLKDYLSYLLVVVGLFIFTENLSYYINFYINQSPNFYMYSIFRLLFSSCLHILCFIIVKESLLWVNKKFGKITFRSIVFIIIGVTIVHSLFNILIKSTILHLPLISFLVGAYAYSKVEKKKQNKKE